MINEIDQNAERSLFTNKGITSHIQDPVDLSVHFDNQEVFLINPLIKKLYDMGYPIDSLNSMLNCGKSSGFVIGQCNCQQKLISLEHHCDLRVCPNCGGRRKKRLRRRFLPFLYNCKIDRTNSLYFLTISPKNYTDLNHGLTHIRKSFAKWRRHKYIKERVKAGFFVIETKQKKDHTWNIHLHVVVYGRRLDNVIRGRCNECGQNRMKFDKDSKKFYCSSSKCNSFNVFVKRDSKLNVLWRQSSGHNGHIDISRLNSVSSTLNYMLKYVSSNKEDFQTLDGLAQYIMHSKGKRLVSSFGLFYNLKIPKVSDIPIYCPHCNTKIEFIFDLQLISELRQKEEYHPPPDLSNDIPHIEVVKIK